MIRVAALLVLALFAAPAAQALVSQDEIRVPVKVADIRGKTVEQEIVVGLFRETSAPAP
ncbi:MAG: hypothetical protein IT434_18595, partial [Phycisphaerales bacterium]|nr:hypothetical protein [Phycisphaerales bacterium]